MQDTECVKPIISQPINGISTCFRRISNTRHNQEGGVQNQPKIEPGDQFKPLSNGLSGRFQSSS